MKSKELEEYFKYFQENYNQFILMSRYICVNQKCKAAYSFAYANLLLSICSDFESLARYIFNKFDNVIVEIEDIINEIENDEFFSKMIEQDVEVDGYGVFKPFKIVNYKNNKFFEWWKSYNKIKHNKLKFISNANQQNVVHALASLYVFNRFAISKCSTIESCPDIFTNDNTKIELINFKTKYSSINNSMFKEVEVEYDD